MDYIIITWRPSQADAVQSVLVINLTDKVYTLADSTTYDTLGLHIHAESRRELDGIADYLALIGYEEVADAGRL